MAFRFVDDTDITKPSPVPGMEPPADTKLPSTTGKFRFIDDSEQMGKGTAAASDIFSARPKEPKVSAVPQESTISKIGSAIETIPETIGTGVKNIGRLTAVPALEEAGSQAERYWAAKPSGEKVLADLKPQIESPIPGLDIASRALKGATGGYVDIIKTPEDAGTLHKLSAGAAELLGMSLPISRVAKVINPLIKGAGITAAALRGLATGGVYGAARSKEEGETRLGNMLKDAAMFGIFEGAGGAIEKVASKLHPDIATTLEKVRGLEGKKPEDITQDMVLTPHEQAIHRAVQYGRSIALGAGAGATEPAQNAQEFLTNIGLGAGTFGLSHGISDVAGRMGRTSAIPQPETTLGVKVPGVEEAEPETKRETPEFLKERAIPTTEPGEMGAFEPGVSPETIKSREFEKAVSGIAIPELTPEPTLSDHLDIGGGVDLMSGKPMIGSRIIPLLPGAAMGEMVGKPYGPASAPGREIAQEIRPLLPGTAMGELVGEPYGKAPSEPERKPILSLPAPEQKVDLTGEVKPVPVEPQSKDIIERAKTFNKPEGPLATLAIPQEAGREPKFEEKPIPTEAAPLPDQYQANAVQAQTLRKWLSDDDPKVVQHLKDGMEKGKITPDEARQLLNDGQSMASRQGKRYPGVIDDALRMIDEFEKTSPKPISAIPETTKVEKAVVPQGTLEAGASVRIGKSPAVHTILEVIPQTDREKELGEQFYKVKNSQTGETETLEAGDLKPVKIAEKKVELPKKAEAPAVTKTISSMIAEGKKAITVNEAKQLREVKSGEMTVQKARQVLEEKAKESVEKKAPWEMTQSEYLEAVTKKEKPKEFTMRSENPQPYGAVEITFKPVRTKEAKDVFVKAIAKSKAGKVWDASSSDIAEVIGKPFFQNETGRIGYQRLQNWLSGRITTDEAATIGDDREFKSAHYMSVMRALQSGKDVPESVLNEYPDLKSLKKGGEPSAEKIRSDEEQIQEGRTIGEGGRGEGRKDLQRAEEARAEAGYEGKQVTNLRSAVIKAGKTYIGLEGQSHDDILKANKLNKLGVKRGFVTPDSDQMLTRKAAAGWMKERQPEAYELWKADRANRPEGKKDELHSQDYWKAVKNAGVMGERTETVAPIAPAPETKLGGITEPTAKPDTAPMHDFSSTQVNLPKSEAKSILDFGKSIPDSEIYTDPNDPTVGREDKPHITVKYGIHTEDPKEIEPLLKGEKSVTATLGKVDVLTPDDKPYDVVVVDVDSPALHDLNAKIAAGTKVTDTYPEYKPHVTIAYVKKGEGAKYKGDTQFEGKEIAFDKVHFTDKDENATAIKLEEKGVPATVADIRMQETPAENERLKKHWQEKLKRAQQINEEAQKKKPFASAKSTSKQKDAQNEIRAYTAILAELDKPASERDRVAQYDIESMLKHYRNEPAALPQKESAVSAPEQKPKPLNIAGQTREEYKASQKKPVPAFISLPEKSQKIFNDAFEAKDAKKLGEIMHLMNKGLRAEFENRTGIKLPKTMKGTHESLEKWVSEQKAIEPASKLTIEQSRDRVAEIEKEIESLKKEEDALTKRRRRMTSQASRDKLSVQQDEIYQKLRTLREEMAPLRTELRNTHLQEVVAEGDEANKMAAQELLDNQGVSNKTYKTIDKMVKDEIRSYGEIDDEISRATQESVTQSITTAPKSGANDSLSKMVLNNLINRQSDEYSNLIHAYHAGKTSDIQTELAKQFNVKSSEIDGMPTGEEKVKSYSKLLKEVTAERDRLIDEAKKKSEEESRKSREREVAREEESTRVYAPTPTAEQKASDIKIMVRKIAERADYKKPEDVKSAFERGELLHVYKQEEPVSYSDMAKGKTEEQKAKYNAMWDNIKAGKVKKTRDGVKVEAPVTRDEFGEKAKPHHYDFIPVSTVPEVSDIIKQEGLNFLGNTDIIDQMKQARNVIREIAKEDPEFSKNPRLTVSYIKADDPGAGAKLVYKVENRQYKIEPSAISTTLDDAIKIGDIKDGQIVEFSPGYLAGRSEDIFAAKKGSETEALYSREKGETPDEKSESPVYLSGDDITNRMRELESAISGGRREEGLPSGSIRGVAFTEKTSYLQDVAKAFGKKVIMVHNERPDVQSFGAMILRNDPSTIYMSDATVAKPHIVMLGHELFHTMRIDQRSLHDELVNALADHIKSGAFPEYKKWYEETFTKGKPIENAEAASELIADLVGNQFSKESFWNRLAEKEPTLFEKVSAFVKQFLDNIKEKLNLAKVSESVVNDVEKVERIVSDAMAKYAKLSGEKVTDTDTMYASKDTESVINMVEKTYESDVNIPNLISKLQDMGKRGTIQQIEVDRAIQLLNMREETVMPKDRVLNILGKEGYGKQRTETEGVRGEIRSGQGLPDRGTHTRSERGISEAIASFNKERLDANREAPIIRASEAVSERHQRIADLLTKIFKHPVIWVQDSPDFAGAIHKGNIFLSDELTGQSITRIFGHELFHSIRKQAKFNTELSASDKRFMDDLRDAIPRNRFEEFSETRNKQNINAGRPRQDESALWEEYGASVMGDSMFDERFWNRLNDKSPSSFQRLVRWVFDKLRNIGLVGHQEVVSKYFEPEEAHKLIMSASDYMKTYLQQDFAETVGRMKGEPDYAEKEFPEKKGAEDENLARTGESEGTVLRPSSDSRTKEKVQSRESETKENIKQPVSDTLHAPSIPAEQGINYATKEFDPNKPPKEDSDAITSIAKDTIEKVKSTVMPGIDVGKGIVQGIKTLVAPTTKSSEHLKAAEDLGKSLGAMNRRQESTAEKLDARPGKIGKREDSLSGLFDKLGVFNKNIALEDNPGMKFASDMSKGRLSGMSPDEINKRYGTIGLQAHKIKKAADVIESEFQSRLDALDKAGAPLETVRENYFPGMWTQESVKAFNQAMGEYLTAHPGEPKPLEDWTAAEKKTIKDRTAELLEKGQGSDKDALQYLTRRPFKGKESYKKQKTFDDIMTAVEFGLHPISPNPMDLVKLKLAEMDRSIMANDYINNTARPKGDIKFLGIGKEMPGGYVRINDKYGTVYGPPTITTKEYVDKNVYEGLLNIAGELGIKHERMYSAGRGRLGWATRESEGKMATQFATELSVLAHEIGHKLDNRYGLWDRIVAGAEGITRKPSGVWEVTKKASDEKRAEIKTELRKLADLSWEGSEVSESYKRQVRKKPEQMAHMLEAYVHAKERFQEVAPTVFADFDKFIRSTPEISNLASIKQGLALKELTGEKSVGGFPIIGYNIAKQPVAEILNNYLSSSLYNNRYFGDAFKGYMGVANALNQSQLGVGSAFHASFTSSEVTISAGANVIKDLYGVAQGNRTVADLGKSLASVPLAAIKNPMEGNAILKEWRNPTMDVPVNVSVKNLDNKVGIIAKAAELAGGGFKLEQGLRTEHTDKMLQEWYGGMKAKAALRSPLALVELAAKPIMEMLVPRQKAGVFGHLVGRIVEQNPDKTLDQLTPEFRQAWNRIDARLGQVRYDRLYMNNTSKNVVQGLVRAPGWSGGTIAEIGGSLKDTAKFVSDWVKTGKAPENIPDRVAYTLSLMVTAAAINGALTYALTGEQPKDLDYWAFRTGDTDDKGRPERFLLPTYQKDIFAYWNNPSKTLLAKTHPMLSVLSDILIKNKDYYGVEIRHKDDNPLAQAGEVGLYAIKQFTPFWMRGVGKTAEAGGHESTLAGAVEEFAERPVKTAAPILGIMPASREYTKTPAERMMDEIYESKRSTDRTRTTEQFEKDELKRRLMKGVAEKGDMNAVRQAIKDGKISEREAREILRSKDESPLVRSFKHLELSDAFRVYDVANEDEKDELKTLLTKKMRTLKDKPLEERKKLYKMYEETVV